MASFDWFDDLAHKVRDLVERHGVDTFREMLREWKNERDNAPLSKQNCKPTLPHWACVGDEIDKPTAPTLAAKYAVAAAIYDAAIADKVIEHQERIDPWQGEKPLKDSGYWDVVGGAGYWAMVADMRRIRSERRKGRSGRTKRQGYGIDCAYCDKWGAMVADVERDLPLHAPSIPRARFHIDEVELAALQALVDAASPEGNAPDATHAKPDELPPGTWLPANGVAKAMGLPGPTVRNKLERLRANGTLEQGRDWIEVETPTQRGARYLYRLESVRGHLSSG